MTIAMQFIEIAENALDVIQCIRTLRMTCQLGYLPGAQVAKNTFRELTAFRFQLGNFVGDIQIVITTDQAQLFDPDFKFGDGLLKIQIIRIHLFLIHAVFGALFNSGNGIKNYPK
jgi:hypothetical protein